MRNTNDQSYLYGNSWGRTTNTSWRLEPTQEEKDAYELQARKDGEKKHE